MPYGALRGTALAFRSPRSFRESCTATLMRVGGCLLGRFHRIPGARFCLAHRPTLSRLVRAGGGSRALRARRAARSLAAQFCVVQLGLGEFNVIVCAIDGLCVPLLLGESESRER